MKRKYLVVYAKGPSSFSGFAPDVEGCFSTGENLDEMRSMLTEALTFHVHGLIADGSPVPEPHTTRIDFSDQDFEGVEYFVVEHLTIEVPAPQALAVSA